MTRFVPYFFLLLMSWMIAGCTILVKPQHVGDVAKPRRAIDYSDPVLNQRRILVTEEITEATADEVVQKLFYLDSRAKEPIDLFLMTAGGDLKAAFMIENAMQLIAAPVNTYAFSECNSAGVVVLAAGTGVRAAFRGAMIVIHGFEVNGKPSEVYVDGTQAYYTTFWKDRANLPQEWLPIPPNQLHFLTAEQALDYGVVDQIIDRNTTKVEPIE